MTNTAISRSTSFQRSPFQGLSNVDMTIGAPHSLRNDSDIMRTANSSAAGHHITEIFMTAELDFSVAAIRMATGGLRSIRSHYRMLEPQAVITPKAMPCSTSGTSFRIQSLSWN